MTPLVVVRSFGRPIEAQLARMRLQSAGIPAFLPDEHVTQIDPLLVDAVGGVRLQVKEEDLERAIAILDAPHDDEEEPDEPTCPACDSPYWKHLRGGRAKCQRCHHTWNDGETRALAPTYRSGTRARHRPTFRLRRGHPGMGLTLGFVAGVVLAIAIQVPFVPVLAAIAGFFFGGAVTYDVCSDPSCRARLDSRALSCPSCKRTIEGVVTSTPEHYRAVAEAKRR